MNDIIDKAIKYCNTITCDKCPRRYKACIMSCNGNPTIGYYDNTTADDLHEMIDFYSNLSTETY